MKKYKNLQKVVNFIIDPATGGVAFLLAIGLIVSEVRHLFLLTAISNALPKLSNLLFYFSIINFFINFIIWATIPMRINK